MDRFPDHSFSIGLQAGRLEGLALPDLLWGLCHERRTGVVYFRHKNLENSVYLDEGRIVFACSNQQDDRLGEQLLRQGRISLAQLDAATTKMVAGKRIGAALVEEGALSPEHLVDAVIGQVKRIFLGLFEWEEGEYHFDEGPLPTEEPITLNISTGELLLSGIRGIRSFSRIRRSVGTPRTMYKLCPGWRTALDGVRLSEGEELLVVRLEQGDESIEGLCREVFLSNFEIYQTLWALKVLGVVEEKVSLAESGDAEWQGNLIETHFADVLVRVAKREETGVLHVSRRMRERTFHFQDGRCVFATSNDSDDGLIAYMLRRGVISLNDREEAAKRLLSNKRVGTILRELGVIDERDLDEMVRQQLSDIVYDTFCWEEGDYAFFPGKLPTIESITLEASIESLVAEGIRRVSSWSKVIEGCGGMNHSLSLSEKYLDVLDGLDAGAEEWKVVNALRDPCPAREVAAAVELPDFRVCQILWTLRALEAIELRPLGQPLYESKPAEPAMSVDVVDLDVPAPDSRESQEAGEESEAPRQGLDVEGELDEEEPQEAEPAVEAPVEDREEDRIRVIEEDATVAEIDVAHVDAVEESDRDELHEPAEEERTIDVVADAGDEEPSSVAVEFVESASGEEPARVVALEEKGLLELEEPLQHDERDSGLLELEASSRTVRLSREEVEAAMQRPPDEQEPGGEQPAAEVAVEVPSSVDEEPPVEVPVSAADEEIPVDDDAAVDEEPLEDGWEPPENLDVAISRFNAMQRLVYSTVRSEVGAGAANFIRACCGDDRPNPIEGTELQSDGTWDIEGLRRQVVEHRIEDPWELYSQLIERELDVLKSHIGEAKVVELQRRVDQVSENYAS